MSDISLRLGACVAALALSAACTAVAPDATWVGVDPNKSEFSDASNWSPAVVPIGIATIPPSGQPPQPLEPQVFVSSPVTLRAIRQGGGAIYGTDVTLTGGGWSVCGKTSMSAITGTVRAMSACVPARPSISATVKWARWSAT
jgi:hypothetical protein